MLDTTPRMMPPANAFTGPSYLLTKKPVTSASRSWHLPAGSCEVQPAIAAKPAFNIQVAFSNSELYGELEVQISARPGAESKCYMPHVACEAWMRLQFPSSLATIVSDFARAPMRRIEQQPFQLALRTFVMPVILSKGAAGIEDQLRSSKAIAQSEQKLRSLQPLATRKASRLRSIQQRLGEALPSDQGLCAAISCSSPQLSAAPTWQCHGQSPIHKEKDSLATNLR